MLKSLNELRTGDLSPHTFQSEVIMQRTLDLEFNRFCKMPSVHNFGYTAMDIDFAEERFLLCGGKNGTISIYDLANTSGHQSYSTKLTADIRPSVDSHLHAVSRVQWYPFDTGLFTTSSKCRKVRIWDANHLVAVDSLELGHHINSHDMSSIASKHNLIAVASCDPNITLYDPKAGLGTHQLSGHKKPVHCVRWSTIVPHLLASGGMDRKILLWDVRSARGPIKCFDQQNGLSGKGDQESHDNTITSLKFTSDGNYLVSCDTENRVKLWNVSAGKNMYVNYGPFSALRKSDRSLPFSLEICNNSPLPILFVANFSNIGIYDLFSGELHRILRGHLDAVYSYVFRSSTQELYSGGNDLSILVWSPCDKREYEMGLIPEALELFTDQWSEDED